jgi:hypothetical protein
LSYKRKNLAEHFGFRKGLSTANAAFKPIDNVLKAINQKIHVQIMVYDFSSHLMLKIIKYSWLNYIYYTEETATNGLCK